MSVFHRVFHVKKRLCYNRKTKMELHRRLKAAREGKGLGVQEVANLLNVKRVQVWRMEKNARFISVERLYELARLYGVDVRSLVSDTIETNDAELPIQVVEMAVEAVEPIAASMSPRPPMPRVRNATVKVVRLIHEQLIEDAKSQIDLNQFTMLIKDHLKEDDRS